MLFLRPFLGLIVLSSLAFGQVPDKAKVVAGAERAFEKASKTNAMPAPGCAVGVSLNGESVFEKAFGMAEMEHGIPNTPQTIFESGSVAKQFTAAALVLLQQDGKLKIDDPVRQYILELPDYGKPLTIRHILTHTAGLRDWGSVMAMTGAGRGDRVVTQQIALDVIYRQKYLDFEPGAEYSYSNSGYQLAAEIVERVSGKKFGEFVAERIFKPLGMTNSSWRDNYRTLVPRRAQAYSRPGANSAWVLNMPIMNVVGNGGMLTTVVDWLKWNAALDARTLGAPIVDALETQGVLNDGRKIQYALGLNVGTYQGMRDVSHGGSTAGYQTFLARYPEKKVSVAVLCNGTSPSAGGLAANVTDEIFGPFQASSAISEAVPAVSQERLQRFVGGVWREERTRVAAAFTVENGGLLMDGVPLRPQADGTFLRGSAIRLTFKYDKDGRPIAAEGDLSGDIRRFVREEEWKPTASELAQFAGDWYSEEAQASFSLSVEGDKIFLVQRPTMRFQLNPLYKDHLSAQGYTFWATRDKDGKVKTVHAGTSRMRDMLFERVRK